MHLQKPSKFISVKVSNVLRALILIYLACLSHRPTLAAESLYWRTRDNRVDADLESWKLPKVLQAVAMSTGWKIYIEPGVAPIISTKFSDLTPAEALPRLLGGLSYALLKKNSGPARLYIYSSSVSSATELIEPPANAHPVDADGRLTRELIVSLKPGSSADMDALAKKLGAKVVGKLNDGTYRLEFESAADADKAKSALTPDEEVASVDSNYQIQKPANPETLALASPTPLNLKPSPIGSSGEVVVGLIDTAVQPQGTNVKDFLLPQQSIAGESVTDNSTLNHGTAMASTIMRGVSLTAENGQTSAKILPIDVYGSRESTTTYDVARGIAAAVQAGANIVNLSLGSNVDTPYLQRMISDLHSKGVLFVGAAGNEPTTAPSYPAAYSEVVAVTAGDRNGKLADYANRGEFVDIIAPGSSIVNFGDKAYMGSGTSYSAAYISGVAAGMAGVSKTTISQVETQLRQKLGRK